MANNTGHVSLWELDTAATITTQSVRIAKLVFEPYNSGDTCTVTDAAGTKKIAYFKAADTSLMELDFPAGRLLPSFRLYSISSGAKLWVYLWR